MYSVLQYIDTLLGNYVDLVRVNRSTIVNSLDYISFNNTQNSLWRKWSNSCYSISF